MWLWRKFFTELLWLAVMLAVIIAVYIVFDKLYHGHVCFYGGHCW